MLRAVVIGCCLLSLSAFGSFPATAYLGKGNELMQAERYDEAALEFKQALQYDQSLEEARKNLAICEFQLRDYEHARLLFQNLGNESQAIATYYLGRIDLIDGNLDSAIARLRVVDHNSGVPDAAYFLAVALFKKGSYGEAITWLRRCVESNPRDFRAHQWLARSLAKTGRSDEADREFKRTRDLHEYYTEGSVAIASCRSLLTQGKSAEAWSACQPMLESDDVDKVAAIATLFGQMEDQSHALIGWQKAVSLDPDSPELNYNLALACFNVHDMPCARRYAQVAFQLWPQFPEASILYGTILYMLADDAEALRVLTHARELRPEDTNVRRLLAELQAGPKAH